MKSNGSRNESITKPLLKELVDRDKANSNAAKQNPSVESTPVEPADLYQDAGEAYNPDFTFPQQ